MRRRLGRDPNLAEIAVFASLCALLLFAPQTPLVQQLVLYARANGMSAVESGSLLVACVFACMAAIALLVSLTFAVVRKDG